MTEFIIFIYFSCVFFLMLYGINCHVMVHLFNKKYRQRIEENQKVLDQFYQGRNPSALENLNDLKLPKVTTQLPIYNEYNVAGRLIDAVCAMRYPEGLHEIQVLDDSTDETHHMIAQIVAAKQAQGFQIHHVVRHNREGFKAGALKNGLHTAMGEYIAIFDADFVPPADFLLRTVPFFLEKPDLGFVQARWGHLNANESVITRLQAMGINGHFMVEQFARNANQLFMNFNGTAGIFRKIAIFEAGNWEGDTLTEDMDLSYRIQLAGWTCQYLINLAVPSEIPTDLNAFKSQQFRWAKGSIQTALKIMPRVLRSDVSRFAKLQAFLHMTHYMVHPLMLTMALLAPLLLIQRTFFLPGILLFAMGVLLILSSIGPSRIYVVAEKKLGHGILRTLMWMPLMICFGCGISINNSRAVVEALLGLQSPFVRTPKNGDGPHKSYCVKNNGTQIFEILAGLWCLMGMVLYFQSNHYLVGHFMLIYAIGFLSTGVISWRHRIKTHI